MQEMVRMKIIVQEHQVYYSGMNNNIHNNGVALISTMCGQPRTRINIVQVYAPKADQKDKEV